MTDSPAGVVVAGGPILTMAQPSRAEAVATRGDRILAVGSLADCRSAAGAGATEVDLGGRALLPGFVDAHIHPLMYGQTSSWLDASADRAGSIDALVELLRGEALKVPADRPLYAYGYDLRRFPERRHPTARDLDRASSEREILLMHASGHGGVVNTAVLNRAGLTAGTPDPDGGDFGRFEDGSPNGRLFDSAWDLLAGEFGVRTEHHGPNIHHADSPDRLMAELEWAQAHILRAGITTVADAQVTRREMESWLALRDAGKLRMRVHMYVLSVLLNEVLQMGLVAPLGDDWLRFAGIKLYADGTLVGRTAWMPDGYPDEPDNHGLLYHDQAFYSDMIRRAHSAGLQTATHALSSAAIGVVLDALSAAERERPRRDARHRIEHCALPTAEQVAQMAALGIVPVAQSQHALLYGDGAIAAAGPEDGGRYHPLGMYARAGVRYALSSDAPVAAPNPLQAVAAAVSRTTVLGTTLGSDDLKVSAEQALRAYTIDAAWGCHAEGNVGSIERGKKADFAIVSSDPTVAAAESVSISETWVGGVRINPGVSA
ncbi:MAG TPA: amidohydrolase [Candidatus Limnocylindria bacterium]|nr:amidohydrolase [Candidatus Limnocylindria bacterium]